MKIFIPEECATPPRADMFLPNWLLLFGFFLDAFAVVCLALAFMMHIWVFLIGFVILGAIGIAAWLCVKNQSIIILDENRFQYTTFLGNKTVYHFSDIKELRINNDSLTLFVGNGKVHMEFIANISQTLMDKIEESLEKNGVDSQVSQAYLDKEDCK